MSALQFKGYAIEDTSDWEKFKLIEFEPKPFGDTDVEIKIHYCGVCGSDVHTITGGWGKPNLPLIVGHEIAGIVTRVGPKVSTFKAGDRVGVGAQVCSCGHCHLCNHNNEQYCHKIVGTYNSKYESGIATQGGYSTGIRCDERFVFPIPDNLKLEEAAPLFCAGLTVFSPLVRNGTGPGKKVGIVGIGGLGHLAIQFAKALGADEIVVFSHSTRKQEDALELGGTKFVVTEDGFETALRASLDLILCTANVASGVRLNEFITTLVPGGRFVMVALPDEALPSLGASTLVTGTYYGGSLLGSKQEAVQMLKLASEKGIKPWIEVLPMSDAGKAVRNVKDGKGRYRYVLKQDIDQ
ncbi:GroES-like protein [Gymnopilus junonius]|uniref:GroES-like protein n=1 Tax=Gymnopilus junonius TaxID=109634 RepID=A0A9P5NFJ5_GYMJU|nr:GroES-like protein [Gymnopilus junonius]